MRRSEFNQLILEWNEYLLVESICESLEDQVLAEGVRSFIKKHGQTVGLLTFFISQLASTNMSINHINDTNDIALQQLAAKAGPEAVEIVDGASDNQFKKAVEIVKKSDVNQVDFISYVTRSFKNSFEESLEESIRIKSFGGIYSKEVYDAWSPSILKNDNFVNEVFDYLNSDNPQAGKDFEYKGMKIFIFPFNANTYDVAEKFVENFFKQIQITSKKNNKKININSSSDLEKLSGELSSLSIDFELKLFKSELKGVLKGIILKYISQKGGVTGYHYNTQAFVEEFKNAAKKLAGEKSFKDLDVLIEMEIARGGVVAIDTERPLSEVLVTIAHEMGHALSIDQGILFNDFIKFLLDNYDLEVKENNKTISFNMFKTFIENRLFRGINWTEIKSEKQDEIIDLCLDFLEKLESSNFLEIIKSEEGVKIQLNVDVLDSDQRYSHDPEERVENLKDWVNSFDKEYNEGSAIKVLTEIKDMIEYVKEKPKSKNRMKSIFSKSLDMQIRFFITKAMLDLKIINKNSRDEAFDFKANNRLILLIKNNNTKDVSDCLDEVNNLIKTYHKYNNRVEHNSQHSH